MANVDWARYVRNRHMHSNGLFSDRLNIFRDPLYQNYNPTSTHIWWQILFCLCRFYSWSPSYLEQRLYRIRAANQTKLKMSDTAVLASTALVMLSVDLDVEWIVWLIEKSLKLNAFYVLMLLKIYVATVNHSKWKERIMYVWVQQLFSLYMWRLWYAFRLPWNQRLLKQTNNMNGSSHQHNAKLQTVSYQMIHLYTVMAVCHLSGWQATLNVRYKWHIFNEHPNNRFSHKHRI